MANLLKTGMLLVIVSISSFTLAGEPGDVVIHGTGGWAVGHSDQYDYLQGEGAGDHQWRNVDLMLNLYSSPSENLRINTQLWYEIEGEETEAELEVAFVEWTLNEYLRFKCGLSRVPFGVYADIFDIGTLRPFYHLPQSVYGSVGIVPEGYAGIGLWGQTGDEWQIVYDLYVGGMIVPDLDVYRMFIDADGGDGGMEESEELESENDVRDIVGGHLVISTPLKGLSFGFSAFSGKPMPDEEGAEVDAANPAWGDHTVHGVQLEYRADSLMLRTEYTFADKDEDIKSYYVELAYAFYGKWQVAGRYEAVEIDPVAEIATNAQSLLDHEDRVIGLNYWLNPYAVIKFAYHDIEGNMLTHPEGSEIMEAVEADELDESNSMVSLGVQFSF